MDSISGYLPVILILLLPNISGSSDPFIFTLLRAWPNLDWSAGRIGLKELWTLKWNMQFNTANEWTKAGCVQPEDWPEWMRNLKDY